MASSAAVWLCTDGELRREPADGIPDADVERVLDNGRPVVRPRRLLIPLTVGPTLLGVLGLARETEDFTREELTFLTAVAARSAVALRNASEYERERELAERFSGRCCPP
ncbi:MAG TPA: GAF domain-containing protein [Amycolatopsis sp.]|uniref:GAF domain-containing protein n=1 Tax=Amycolatopsis sp. TaxID=37632 RepID=UPI002B475D30|nr:GAF domain-containing protein [Amycolatopsis sp.]HKS44058.1 GAF domain-containing protein [Amycolatopsis sp.]